MQYPGAQKKPFDIITSIKLHCQSTYFFWGKARSWHIIRASVHTIFTVEYALIGIQYFKQRDTSAISGKGMADPCFQAVAASVFPMLPASAFLATPLEVHATSYFAASDNIASFCCNVAFSCNIIANHNPFPSRNRNLNRTFVRIISPGPYPVNKHCPANCFLL